MKNTASLKRKDAVRIERELAAHGVYKPYVSQSDDVMHIESYPLTATVRPTYDAQNGPGSLIRVMNQGVLVGETVAWFGSPVVQYVANIMVPVHAAAYAERKAIDAQYGA